MILEVILIGVALAMDAFALTIANCTTYKNSLTKKNEWSMPCAFAFFQFLMPVIGYFVGSLFMEKLQSVSGYITAGIFFVLSAKIIYDNIKDYLTEKNGIAESNTPVNRFGFAVLIIQAVATSIDALMIGVTFSVELSFSVFLAGAIIGVVTFIIVTVALFIGRTLGRVLGKYATWLGAVILFGLAVKNLISAII